MMRHSYFELTSLLAARMAQIKPKNQAMSEDAIDALFAAAKHQQSHKG